MAQLAERASRLQSPSMNRSNVYESLRWGSTWAGFTPGSANGLAIGTVGRWSGWDRLKPWVRSMDRPAGLGTSADGRGGVTPSGSSTWGGRWPAGGGTLDGWRAGSSIDAPRRPPPAGSPVPGELSRSMTMS